MRTWSEMRWTHRRAWSLLRGPLAWWFVPGAAMTLGLAALGWWGIAIAADRVTDWMLSMWMPEIRSDLLQSVVEWLIWLLLLVVKIKLTKYVVLVVMGPLLAAVSEAVETQITGVTLPFSWSRWFRDAIRGLRSAMLLASFEWSLTLVLWAIGLTAPVMSPLTLTMAWMIGAWAYGASVMDYVWEREGKDAWSGLKSSLRHSGTALRVGIPFALWVSVPVLAWTIGPLMGGMGATATACVALKGASSNHGATT